ncbi:MAG: glycosyltransferase [Streptococcus mutans]|uniref:Glycosyltransferase n=3 Tax=Lactobacillales TaxID=186826 RepID=A0AAP2K9K2_STRAP|nr:MULTISPECIES: glycosyltransferase [Streptococcus]KAA9296460.1 glycosyltransferase family 2 protein [Streptococcus anginosus]KUM00047.1 glycosyl transferase [Streptococcus anginosus]MBF7051146.1 glycosyltransferase family 2 protein [Streptococcus sp. HF-2466]MBZ2155747.1 glycosyltransferase [Streptococcus anginosus]MCW1076818.1 glycosyltransferase [Streptococcus anginosus]
MISQLIMIITLVSIWLSLVWSLVTLSSGVHFWLKHSDFKVDTSPLESYPMVTIVVPAHNEDVVIAQTTRAILDMNYPHDKVELLLFADNCEDTTYQEMLKVKAMPEYATRDITITDRKGTGGKAGVLNDALKMAKGEYICVYDADAMPEKNALYFLVKKVLEDPERHVASFGRNKTRNANQNFLTRCINQEIVVTQRIQHVGMWHMFKIGRIPGTNFIINTEFVKSIGGWRNGALTEDTDISFKIMQSGKLIALAYNSEAFQQEPETVKSYYMQRKRWAKGNYEVVISNFKHLFDKSNWRVKLEVAYYSCVFFWFNAAIILSDIVLLSNVIAIIVHLFVPSVHIPFTFDSNNIYIAQLMLFNWLLMIMLYLLQINIALASQFGQATSKQIWLALISYFTYSQLFIIVSIDAVTSVTLDKLFHRDGTKWVKTKRFAG